MQAVRGGRARGGRAAARAAGGFLLACAVVAGLAPPWDIARVLGGGARSPGPAWAAQPGAVVRIGIVDMQAVIAQSAKGQKARAQLEADRAAKQKQLEAMQAEVQRLQAELERQKDVLTPPARREKEEAIQRKAREAQNAADDGSRELQQREARMVAEIQEEIFQVIAEYGKERRYDIILERSAGIWFVGERADLTKDILGRYNSRFRP